MLALIARELGHWKLHHFLFNLAIASLQLFLWFFVIGAVLFDTVPGQKAQIYASFGILRRNFHFFLPELAVRYNDTSSPMNPSAKKLRGRSAAATGERHALWLPGLCPFRPFPACNSLAAARQFHGWMPLTH